MRMYEQFANMFTGYSISYTPDTIEIRIYIKDS